jgi:hypothetical protein
MSDENSNTRPLFLVAAIVIIAGIAFGGWLLIQRERRAASAEAFAAAEAEALQVTQAKGQFGDCFVWTGGRYAAIVGWPDAPPKCNKPIFLLLIHYPPASKSNHYSFDRKISSADDWHITMEGSIGLPDGRQLVGQYLVSSKDPVEKFTWDGKTSTADAGRVFLLELSAASPDIKQLSSDLTKLIRKPDIESHSKPVDPTPQIREALTKLRAEHEEVARFLEGSPLQ